MAEIRTKGTVLQLSISSVFTTITQGVKIKLPKRKRGDIEMTDLADNAKSFAAGIKEAGEVEFEFHTDQAAVTHAALETSYGAGTTDAWKVVWPNATAVAFSGYINEKHEGDAEIDGKFLGSIKIKIDGDATITP